MARVIIRLKQSFIIVLPCLSGQLVLSERPQGTCEVSSENTPLVDGNGKLCLKYSTSWLAPKKYL